MMRGKRSAALESSCQRARLNRVVLVVRHFRGLARMHPMPKVFIFLVAGALVAEPAYQQAVTILGDSFEKGTIQSTLWNESSTNGCNPTVQSGDAAEGKYYLRSSLTANPPNGGNYRCEQNAIGLGTSTQLNTPYYYGMSVRVPSDFANDRDADDTIMQLHHQPTTNPNSHHMISIENNLWEWQAHADAGGPNATLAPLAKAQWIRFCVRAVWIINSSGSLKVWVNPSSESSTPAFQWSGQTLPTAYTNIAKFKIGLYKTKWRTNNFPNPFNSATSPRVVEHDDVRVGLSFAAACGGRVAPEPPSLIAVE